MENNFQKQGFLLGVIFIFSYVSNFLWESFHLVIFYEGPNIIAEEYVPMVNYISVLDSLCIVLVYLIVAGLWKDFFWLKKMNLTQIVVFVVLGLMLAALIEYLMVYFSKIWQYPSYIPILFAVGLSPLVQVSITGFFAVCMTKRLLRAQ